jgi:hypothetical protein
MKRTLWILVMSLLSVVAGSLFNPAAAIAECGGSCLWGGAECQGDTQCCSGVCTLTVDGKSYCEGPDSP